jgi:hypothetical protein
MRHLLRLLALACTLGLLSPLAPASGTGDPDIDACATPRAVQGGGKSALAPAPGRMLVDYSHRNVADVSGYTDYLVSLGWIVDLLLTGPVTESLLAPYTIFLVPPGDFTTGLKPFSQSEITAVRDYVTAGGGVWLFNEYDTYPVGINSLASDYGFTFNDDFVFDYTDNEQNTYYWPTIHNIKPHVITRYVRTYGYYAGCSLNIDDPASEIAGGDDDSYSDEYSSVPPVLFSVTVGSGRVVGAGDATTLHPNYYPSLLREEEKRFLDNIVEWLGCAPSAASYGSGWPGTQGEPQLAALGDPLLCTGFAMSLSNSAGVATSAVVLVGFVEADLPTVFGGHVLVLPYAAFPVSLPAAGATLHASLPCNSDLCGLSVFLQAFEVDPGASRGVAFSSGMRLLLGQ